MSIHSSQIYYINSNLKLSGTTSHFSYTIQIPAGSQYDRVCLLQANIPISYYIVAAGQNSFTFREYKGTLLSSISITIPVGNYNVNSFLTIVQTLLNLNTFNAWTYTITFPNSYIGVQTGKYTFTITSSMGVSDYCELVFTNGLYEQFGFNENSVNRFISGALTSSNIVSFIPESSLYIHSDIVNNSTGILQEIFHNNAVPLSNAIFQCNDVMGYSKPLRTNQSNAYTFSLVDQHGNGIDLNGLNVVMTLLLFKKDDTADMIRSFLKLSALS